MVPRNNTTPVYTYLLSISLFFFFFFFLALSEPTHLNMRTEQRPNYSINAASVAAHTQVSQLLSTTIGRQAGRPVASCPAAHTPSVSLYIASARTPPVLQTGATRTAFVFVTLVCVCVCAGIKAEARRYPEV